jgi:hypothetical protein
MLCRPQVAGLWIILAGMSGLSILMVIFQNLFYKGDSASKAGDANMVSVVVRPSPRGAHPANSEHTKVGGRARAQAVAPQG